MFKIKAEKFAKLLKSDEETNIEEIVSNIRELKNKMNDIKPHTVRISKSLLKRCKTEVKIKGLKLFEVINMALFEYLEIV